MKPYEIKLEATIYYSAIVYGDSEDQALEKIEKLVYESDTDSLFIEETGTSIVGIYDIEEKEIENCDLPIIK